MKPVFYLLAASTVGLSCVFTGEIQASTPDHEVLIAQRGFDEEGEDIDTKPIDRSKIKDGSGKNTWVPLGYNKNRVATFWARLSTYKPLNENSFRVQVQYTNNKGRQFEGRMDVNCKNKDYYVRPNGVLAQNAPWAVVPKGSGIETLARYFCKETSARSEWGYKDSTKYLWDAPTPPSYSPVEATGEWIQFMDRADIQSYYNDDVIIDGNNITFGMWSETTKGDMSTDNQDIQSYHWIVTNCKRNLFSLWVVLDESVDGIWGPPMPGRPGGGVMTVRKKFCN